MTRLAPLVLLLLLGATRPATTSSPDVLADAAKALTEERYPDALELCERATTRDRANPEFWTIYGDASYQLSGEDPNYLGKARNAWDQALIVQPDYLPALERMMKFYSDLADLSGASPDLAGTLAKIATKVFAADPNNADAEVLMHTAWLRVWISGVEPDARLQRSMDKCRELMAKYPHNTDLPLYLAQAKMKLGNDRAKGVDAAAMIMADAPKRSPTAAMYFAAAQVEQQPKKRRELFDKAMELAKPDDPIYLKLHLEAARDADPASTQKILRNLHQQRPDDQQVRLAFAEQLALDSKTRAQAIAILNQPIVNSKLIGPRSLMAKDLQLRTLAETIDLRLDDYEAANPTQRQALLKPIEDAIQQLRAREGDDARAFRLQGRLLDLQGEKIKAIVMLEKRARTLADKILADPDERRQTVTLLARVYISTHQLGRAKQLLTELVQRYPDDDPSRILLAQVLLKDHQPEEAKPHIEELTRRRPNDPAVIKLRQQLTTRPAAK